MILTRTAIDYLPTNTPSDFPVGALAISIGIAVLLIILILAVGDDGSASGGDATGILITLAVLVSAIPFFIGFHHSASEASDTNVKNLVTNVENAYNIDDIEIDETEAALLVIGDKHSAKATVHKGNKKFEVIVSQNAATFEPTLSSADSSLDMSELKK